MPANTRPALNYSVNPPSGYWQNPTQVIEELAFPHAISSSFYESGFAHQTFLGASITNFGVNAGFGDSVSTLNVDLVVDEYNRSDRHGAGAGDDPYHSGLYDNFAPPMVGSPVFFKFGKQFSTIEDAYLKVFDTIYSKKNVRYNEAETRAASGMYHFTFGGILQSYVQNRGPGGDPLYSVQVVDPREVLSNTTIILNNYAGTTFSSGDFSSKNLFNVYGFLEYNPTQELKEFFGKESFDIDTNQNSWSGSFYSNRFLLQKTIDNSGAYYFQGNDLYTMFSESALNNEFYDNIIASQKQIKDPKLGYMPFTMPITGTGFSRRCSHGMPFYRIKQAMRSLLGLDGFLPKEYVDAGFGGTIKFRGFNYLIDFSNMPKLDDFYFFDYDQINLLDFCLEICDITNHALFVSLLPVINHPVCRRFYDHNIEKIREKKFNEIFAGIIKLDFIDKSFQPRYGAIKDYIDSLRNRGIPIENQDVGFELTNISTDKFLVGAQEVDMYYFTNNSDRDNLEERKRKRGNDNILDPLIEKQWYLETTLSQQILPYYGLLGENAVTVPKGFGAYQQILLDSSSLNAVGVGNYYVATELELRAALISYDKWCEFLLTYDSIYMESIESNDLIEGQILTNIARPDGSPEILEISNNYAVTVPRSVWRTDKLEYKNGLPTSACNPPYGFPLYYKRATQLGVQGAGLSEISSLQNSIITDLASFRGTNSSNYKTFLDTKIKEFKNKYKYESSYTREYKKFVLEKLERATNYDEFIGIVDKELNNMSGQVSIITKLQKSTKNNSIKVYDWLKKIAEECLGKKFLIKIPKEVNLYYNKEIKLKNNDIGVVEYEEGPFGFKPRKYNNIPGYEYSQQFKYEILQERDSQTLVDWRGLPLLRVNMVEAFLSDKNPNPKKFHGALESNFNPITDQFEFNYDPENEGGFTDFDLQKNISNNKPLVVQQLLQPQDLTNFLSDNSRILPYVRFDNSQDLIFDSLDSSDFTQQYASGYYSAGIPDLSESLDNIKPENNIFQSFPQNINQESEKQKTVAFLKCNLDDKFYMVPRSSGQEVYVHATRVVDLGKFTPPKDIFDCSIPPSGGYKASFGLYEKNLVPLTSGDKIKWIAYSQKDSDLNDPSGTKIPAAGKIFIEKSDGNSPKATVLDFFRGSDGKILTSNEFLDTNNVYALITLPSRIKSVVDARFRDSLFQEINTANIKHFLSMDVVKIPDFKLPAFKKTPSTNYENKYKTIISPDRKNNALNAVTKALDNLKFGLPQKITAISPSPIYPDLVVLPLLSKERSYGPWIASQLDPQARGYESLGGRIDFIKDENLSPWNFGGYDLLNSGALSQVKFSSSLLLQSERGGFTITDAPSGIYLGKFLSDRGPLVTSIDVSISDGGIRTTYKMDLYTVSFGKLAKQKEDQISNISRERQKLRDERNSLIRKNLSKNQNKLNFNSIYTRIKKDFSNMGSSTYSSQPRFKPPTTMFASTDDYLYNYQERRDSQQIIGYGDDSPPSSGTREQYSNSASFASMEEYSETLSQIIDPVLRRIKEENSAYLNLADNYVPASYIPHQNIPYFPNIKDEETRDNFYQIEEE